MKADLPLIERRRIEAQDQRELRAAIVRRHAEVLDQQHAIEGVHVAMDVRGPAFRELTERMRG